MPRVYPATANTTGAGDTFTHAGTTPYTVGGIAAGSGPYVSATIQAMFTNLLYPYVHPTFATFTLDTGLTVEVGYTITGNHTFAWTTTTPANIVALTLDLRDVTGALNLETNISVTSPKVHDFTAVPIQKLTELDNLFRVSADDTSTATFTRDYTVQWMFYAYAGTSANAGPLNEAQIEALTDYAALTRTAPRTYAMSAGNYKYFAFPTTFVQPTTFKDQATNLDIPMEAGYNVNLTNTFAVVQAYTVYRTTNILGAAISVVVS